MGASMEGKQLALPVFLMIFPLINIELCSVQDFKNFLESLMSQFWLVIVYLVK